MQRVKQRLTYIVPFTIVLIILLLYINTRSFTKTMIVLLAVPFSAIGAVWFLYFAGYNMSVAVWVGLIALLGVDAETGVFMLLYLDLSYEEARREGRLRNSAGPARSHRPRSCKTSASQVHDLRYHLHRLVSHHVGGGGRFRRNEAHCRTHGRRYFYLFLARAACVSGDLRDLEGASCTQEPSRRNRVLIMCT